MIGIKIFFSFEQLNYCKLLQTTANFASLIIKSLIIAAYFAALLFLKTSTYAWFNFRYQAVCGS